MTQIRIRLCASAAGLAAAGLFATGCAGGDDGGGADPAGAAPAAAGSAAAPAPAGKLIDATSPDGHPLREVPRETAPAVRLEVTPDSESGWNVQVKTERYRWAPGKAGQQAAGGEGHAHLYLDGERIARLYGEWFHVPADAVPDGPHELSAILTASDHSAWAADGRPIEDAVRVTGRAADAGGGEHSGQDGGHAGHGGA
ncbi:hypothetical protein [Streptomyces sp. JJ36]|uniref:hypothetical protein n=1 Tax=Streptomyces sp. JJ36 TaxID=2736645 RepID=UPI001F2D8542|nr:hypothetical protein [Streptomyces sp. JJ36]MCF6521899.1 hypothetical protein [Streptomyces sp. JJ36]